MYAELTDQLQDIIAECDGMTRIRLYKLPHGTNDIATLPDEDSEAKTNNVI
jgi:hypothetical protein